MPDFSYKAKDQNGIAHAGVISAPSQNQAVLQLRERRWIILRLENTIKPSSRDSIELNLLERIPPRSVNVELSIQQLALMIRSGMTLLSAISSVAEQSTSRSLQKSWRSISQQIQAGKGLSEAMAQHRCFPEFVIRLVQVGEQTGNLEVVLKRAASTMRNRRDSREALASATIYPVLILVLAAAVTGYMVVYLIPRLEAYLQSLGKEMPAMTESLITMSFWLRSNFLALVTLIVILSIAFILFYASKEGRLVFDQYSFRFPIIGKLMRIRETSSLARSLSMMLRSGITLTEGLGAAENTLSNHFQRQNVADARSKIIRGGNLVEALDGQGAFGPMLSRMAAVGQQTGELDVVLHEVAELYDSQLKSTVKRLNAILTPLMTIGIGGVLGYVYIAFFMALVAAGS